MGKSQNNIYSLIIQEYNDLYNAKWVNQKNNI